MAIDESQWVIFLAPRLLWQEDSFHRIISYMYDPWPMTLTSFAERLVMWSYLINDLGLWRKGIKPQFRACEFRKWFFIKKIKDKSQLWGFLLYDVVYCQWTNFSFITHLYFHLQIDCLKWTVWKKECYFSVNAIWGSRGHMSLHANRVWFQFLCL